MRFCGTHINTKWIYLVVIGVLLSGKTLSQLSCTNKWSAPVWQENFGVGTGQVSFVEAGSTAVTNYKLVSNDCPNDGEYVVTRATGEGVAITCFNNAWPTISQDHTGQTNGRFAIFNAANNPGQFYEQKINGLCGGRKYEFGIWAASILFPQICSGVGINPDLTFSIETASGTLLKTYNTGAFPKNDPLKWLNFKFEFELPKGQHQVVLKISNVAGGCGNDLAIDDLSLRICQPQVSVIALSTSNQVCAGSSVEFTSNLGTETDLVLQWQQSATVPAVWKNILGANQHKVSTVALQNTHYRLLMATDSASFNAQCAWASDTVGLVVKPISAACNETHQIGFYDGDAANLNTLFSDLFKTNVSWVNSNPATGLPSGGSGSVPNFVATNSGTSPATTTLTVSSNTDSQQKITLKITVYPQIKPFAVTGGGELTASETQKAVALNGSQLGVTYVLIKNGLPTNLVLDGTGLPLNFGKHPSGTYTVAAYWPNAESIAKTMNGNAVVTTFDCPPQTPVVVPSSQAVCSGTALEDLFGFVDDGFTVDWYDALTGGNLLLAGSLTYKPTGAGVFYALARNTLTNCAGTSRASSTVEVFEKPAFELEIIPPTCDETLAQNDAKIKITNAPKGVRFAFSKGETTNQDLNYETAIPVPLNGILVENIENPSLFSESYTIRIFDENGCFSDKTVLIEPFQCNCGACVLLKMKRKTKSK